MKPRLPFIGLLFVLAIPVVYLWQSLGDQPLGDELVHYEQVRLFWQGLAQLEPRLTLIPGYHGLAAALTFWLPGESINYPRLVTVLMGIVTLLVFYKLIAEVNSKADARLRTAQLAVLPILFPFWFLAYTDVAALLTTLLMLWLALVDKHRLSGLVGWLGIVMRQSHVAWVAAGAVLSWWRCRASGGGWLHASRAVCIHLLALASFAVFLWWNGGLALAQNTMHPAGAFHLSTLWFALVTHLLLFLPLHLLNLKKLPTIAGLWRLPVALAVGVLAAWSFDASHPYNQLVPEHNLRNALVLEFAGSTIARVVLGVLCGWVIWSLMLTPLARRWQYAFYPVAGLFIGLHWLIEPRYFLVPIAMFLAFLGRQCIRTEILLLIWWLIATLVLVWGLANKQFWL